MAHDIFISYARPDLERVRPLVRVLRRAGWTVWWDRGLLGGTNFAREIPHQLNHAKAIIVVWTESSLDSDWVQGEAEVGRKRGVMVPLRLDAVTPPLPFGQIQTIDHFAEGEPSGPTLTRLLRSLGRHIGKAPIQLTPQTTETAPSSAVEPLESAPKPSEGVAGTLKEFAASSAPSFRVRVRGWPRGLLIAGVLSISLCVGWLVRGARVAEGGVPHYVVEQAAPAFVESIVDPASGCLVPKGWEVVDGTLGVNGWAKQVREPRSGVLLQLVPPGEFLMGSPESEPERGLDETQHRVRLTRPFYLRVTEVTDAQVRKLRNEPGGSDLPIQNATWFQARAFCKAIECELPTEAQWEYAARAGATGRWWWGDAEGDGRTKANILDGTAGRELGVKAEFSFDDGYTSTAPVGRFAANAYGFHDMIGNVWEWCFDDYAGDYGPGEVVDPVTRIDGAPHVLRGGSAFVPARQTRLACRLAETKAVEQPGIPTRFGQTGFRVALTLH
jgi:formylglycine-generating enzyme required for sulfatase activity